MDNTETQNKQNIDSSIEKFIEEITSTYGISRSDLNSQWCEKMSTLLNEPKLESHPPMCIPVNDDSSVTSSPTSSESSSTAATGCGCPYKFTKGKNKGGVCGKKTKDGLTYCSRHKKFEGSVQSSKKALPNAKKATKKDNKTTTKKVSKILRKNHAIDHLWHEHTRLVFRSAKERVVIGVCVDDEIVPLSDADILVCKDYSFAYELGKVEEVEEEVEEKVEEKVEDERKEWDVEFMWNPQTQFLYDKNDKKVGKVTDVDNATIEFHDYDEEDEEEGNCYSKAVRKVTSTDDVAGILEELQLEEEELDEEE